MTRPARTLFGAALGLLITVAPVAAQEYPTPEEVTRELADVARANRNTATLHTLAESPGGRAVTLLELGRHGAERPGILAVANMEGNSPPSTLAALMLADSLTGPWSDELERHTWYLVALGNPDGYARYFAEPRADWQANETPVDADVDGRTDEDGFDDLNGDGYITVMRQKHPEGTWIQVEGLPLLRKADRAKGEAGVYRLLPEGLDNDGDGRINEDKSGGVNPGRNFPHAFEHYTETGGMWPGSAAEARSLLTFGFGHDNIAMTLVLGRADWLSSVPEGRKGQGAAQDTYTLPERWAERWGIDPEEKFKLADLLELARDMTGYRELTEEMLLQWLGAGAAMKPSQQDAAWWKTVTEKYEEFLKQQGLEGKRVDAPDAVHGSLEEWAYYQLGVPSFAMNFWTPAVAEEKEVAPADSTVLTPDAVREMSAGEIVALGEERIAELLEASGAPAMMTPERVLGALESGRLTPEKMAEFMEKTGGSGEMEGVDEVELALVKADPASFVQWTAFDHPELGAVEIGGLKPWADLAPPPAEAEELAAAKLPFLLRLTGMLPELSVDRVQVTRRAAGVYEIETWVVNRGFLPHPTHHGARTGMPVPIVAELDGDGLTFIEGRPRKSLGQIEGSGGYRTARWVVQGRDGAGVTLRVHAPAVGELVRGIKLTGGVQ